MPYTDLVKKKEYHAAYNKKWCLRNKDRYKKECKHCGEPFSSRYSAAIYCSKKCSSLGRRCSQICKECGKVFFAPKCKKRIYCSRNCSKNSPMLKKHIYRYLEKRKNNHVVHEKWITGLRKASKTADRSKQSAHCKSLIGSKNPMWKGGVTPEYRKLRMTKRYKEWRSSVFKRDLFTCQECGIRSSKKKHVILQAHHLVSFAELLKTNRKDSIFDIKNGVTLCLSCHRKTDTYAKNYKTPPLIDYLPKK